MGAGGPELTFSEPLQNQSPGPEAPLSLLVPTLWILEEEGRGHCALWTGNLSQG